MEEAEELEPPPKKPAAARPPLDGVVITFAGLEKERVQRLSATAVALGAKYLTA
jgi:hypothetical protein